MTNEKLEASVSSGKDDTSVMAIGSSVVEASELPIVKLPVATKGKLFSDSESSDDELFKPVPSIKKPLAVVPRTSIVSENLNQSGSFEEKSSSNPPKPPLGRSLPLSFLDDDSDGNLSTGLVKQTLKEFVIL